MPGGAGRDDYDPMPTGGSGANYGAPGTGNGHHVKTKTTFAPKKKTVSTTDGTGQKKTSLLDYSLVYQGGKALVQGIKSIFQPKTEQQKVEANIKKGYDVNNPSEMRAAETKKTYDWGPTGGEGGQTFNTQSLVTAPTADKGAGFGHQWNFQAYGANQNVAANPYDYTKAPYAKKGKMIRKYGTGQEIKNFSQGKRFGPPPLKGPDSQGIQVILENSDYFKKLIG